MSKGQSKELTRQLKPVPKPEEIDASRLNQKPLQETDLAHLAHATNEDPLGHSCQALRSSVLGNG
jgi:hypothetical protein